MAITRSNFSDNFFDDYGARSRREIEELRKMEYMHRQAMAMQEAGFTQSGTGAVESKLAKPEKPKHLNPKLLLTKGA
jgi:hypothetical protein